MRNKAPYLAVLFALFTLAACTFGFDPNAPGGVPTLSGGAPSGDTGTVVQIIDGDTIDVRLPGGDARVRYIGVNTPERDEVCYREATQANRLLVEGKTVRLVRDAENTDQYGRLLRYIYVDNLFVNAALVQQGFAEVVSYPPNTAQYEYLKSLEIEATNANRGCHPTGIFDDGSYTR
ncbi:MAG: thermonuclease family protein [Chloroflexi bacterium]|nr:thermonuclease family protein [Chloroflexota bacterium]